MFKIYLITSIVCVIINIMGSHNIIKRFEKLLNTKDLFAGFLFSIYGIQIIILGIIPIVNLLIVFTFLFGQDLVYNNIIKNNIK